MKYEFKLQTITHNTKNTSRITEEQADFLIKGANGNLSDLIDRCGRHPLDGAKKKLTPGMYLIASPYHSIAKN